MEPPSKKPSSSSGTSQPRRERRRRERENRAEQPEAGPSTLPSKPPSETRRRRKRKNKENGDTATGEFDAVSGEFDGLDSEKNDADNAGFEIGEDFVPFVDSEPPTPPPTEHADTARRKDRDRDTRRDDAPTREWDKGKGRTRDWEWDSRNDSGSKRKHDTMIDMDEVYANNRKQREQAQSRRAPWLDNIDWDSCNNVAEMLHREVESFVNYISPSPIEDEVRGLVVKLVSRAVTQAFPDAQVLPFGSYETKLYLPLGDIDLVIHSDSMAYSDKVIVLRALAGALKRAGITSNVTIIAKAKVPIIKFVTTHGRFNVDVSVNQGNGVVAGQIVNGFLKEMDGGGMALRSLVMVTKAFLSQRSMNEVYSGGLGSYSIVCLAVSFLQMHPKIRRGEIDAEKNLGVLVMEFFELYGCYFNYEEVGISVRDGGTYYSKKQRGWLDYYKRHLLSIEDPTDPSNDISKGSYGFNKVRATFAGAHGIMTTAAYLRASLISSRREGRSSSFRETYAPEDLSILSSVMGVTQETINHRKLVQEVYDKRTLHRLVGVAPLPPPVVVAAQTNGSRSEPSGSQKPPSISQPAKDARSRREEVEEADMDLASEDEDDERRRAVNVERVEVEEEEDGRYDISGRPRPKKRQKTSAREDLHTVFTTDDDDDDGDTDEVELVTTRLDSLEAEEREYDTGPQAADSEPSAASAARRSYWLSKGIAGAGDESS